MYSEQSNHELIFSSKIAAEVYNLNKFIAMRYIIIVISVWQYSEIDISKLITLILTLWVSVAEMAGT